MNPLKESIRVLDLDGPKEPFLSSLPEMSAVDICKANIFFSRDGEELLINNMLYHLNCSDPVKNLVPTIMPTLVGEYQLNALQPTQIFSL